MERTIAAEITRPKLLGGIATATALAAAASCFSLLNLAAERRAEPVEIRAGVERLEAVLASAPAAGFGDGPVVWAVTAPDCAECPSFAAEDVRALQREGFDVRLVRLGMNEHRRGVVAEVVEQNGKALKLPALFWKRGDSIRGALGRDPDARERLRADFDWDA